MARVQRKTLDIITLFHKASSPASVRVANLLKQASASAQTSAAEDAPARRDPFELNITEDPPTVDQVQTILEYVGQSGASQIVKGARDDKDALKKFKENKDNFLRPLVSSLDGVGGTSYIKGIVTNASADG